MSNLSLLRSLPRISRVQSCTVKKSHQTSTFLRLKSTKTPKNASVKAENALNSQVKQGAPSEVEKETLPWAEYLSIRKTKRRWETVRGAGHRCWLAMLNGILLGQAMTIPMTIAGFAGGIAALGNMEIDPTKPIFVRTCLAQMPSTVLTEYRISTPCSSLVALRWRVQVKS
jgi:mitochondrial import inner membrane translocase subunit TIM23